MIIIHNKLIPNQRQKFLPITLYSNKSLDLEKLNTQSLLWLNSFFIGFSSSLKNDNLTYYYFR